MFNLLNATYSSSSPTSVIRH